MIYLGFDPGRQKCGVAVMDDDRQLHHHAVIPAEEALEELTKLCDRYAITQIILGDQTASKAWQQKIQAALPHIPVQRVDERNSSLEARDRYWQMYPPKGLTRLLPKGMRNPPRPIDDIVAILLIERYWAKR
jgi:RNase H-fold protein (predicted Holliday junction resolvase)